MSGTAISEGLQHNQAYVSQFNKGSLPLPPAKRVAYVVCMDARIDPAKALGLQEGMHNKWYCLCTVTYAYNTCVCVSLGDAHVTRNAGGRFKDAERSIVISQTLLGTKEVAFVHHTDCGMLTFTDDKIRQQLRDSRHVDADHIAFLPFSNLEQSVLDDIKALRYMRRLRMHTE